MDKKDAAIRIRELNRELSRHDRLYYIEAQPEISDKEYDALFDELIALEQQYPELQLSDSATLRVGSDLAGDLPEVAHSIPVLSLDKAYSQSTVQDWVDRVTRTEQDHPAVVVEEKIDGSSIVLYYEKGLLTRAVTRGNGRVGNDVTANVRTIRSIPLSLPEPVDLVVRGEIYIPLAAFAAYNRLMGDAYANPRNLAAGTLRSVRSKNAAAVPLEAYIYEGFFKDAPDSHIETLHRLHSYGFRMNPNVGFFCDDSDRRAAVRALSEVSGRGGWTAAPLAGMGGYVAAYSEKRAALGYEIDGLVIKIDRISLREELGYTAHHPRWAIAYKFESPQTATMLRSITVQIGRNGRVTPVAELEPVSLAGSTISRATLHNQDYIGLLELAPGDTVSISRRGDVIPAVDSVLEKGEGTTWSLPEVCPECATPLIRSGAHHFCPNINCPARLIGRLVHFAGKAGLDIDGLGEKTIRFLFTRFGIQSPQQLFLFDYARLLEEEGFGEKKIQLIQRGLEAAARSPFSHLLGALGLEGLGRRSAEALIAGGFNTMDDLLTVSRTGDWEAIAEVEGFGEILARQLVATLADPGIVELIHLLQERGFSMAGEERLPVAGGLFEGQTWCVTGSFVDFKPRELAAEAIVAGGGRVTSSVTGKTTHLLAGEKAGSKLKKAEGMGIPLITEQEFKNMLGK